MRVIKFRGCINSTNALIYGDLSFDDDKNPRIEDNKGFWEYVEPETVGQFTGLHDGEGTEIYEGDILAYWGGEDKVVSFEGRYCIEHTDCDHFDIDPKTNKVIGNIHTQTETK